MAETRRGFSLLEIVVVLAIIAVLATVLLAVIARSREGTRRIHCAANLSQIGLAFRVYLDDYSGWYPPVRDCWTDSLWPYLAQEKSYRCPSSQLHYKPGCPPRDVVYQEDALSTAYAGSYSYNCMDYGGMRRHEMTHPTSTILALDGNGRPINPGEEPLLTPELLRRKVVLRRHAGGNNVLFVDYHVKWCSFNSLTERSLWIRDGR